MKNWGEIISQASIDVDEQYAEALLYTQMSRPDDVNNEPHIAGDSFEVQGIFNETGLGVDVNNDIISMNEQWISISENAFTTPPQIDDKFTRLNKDYIITGLSPDGQGRMRLELRMHGQNAY